MQVIIHKKKHKEDIAVRSLLLKTLIEDLNDPTIIFNQKISSQWAIESIKKCKSIYKINSLDFVIGSDLITNIFSWKNFEQIIKEIKFFIIVREGYTIKSNTLLKLNQHKVNFQISTLDIPNISSSMVRINSNNSDLPRSLLEIVNTNNLYMSKKPVE